MRVSRVSADEKGQSTAFVASLLFVMFLFVAVVANVGQAVNRRIALQIVADAGAYTGASVMAVGMNQLAVWNRLMQYDWLLFTNPLSPMWFAFEFHDTSCSGADTAEGLYYSTMAVLNLLYWGENIGYSYLATSQAEDVSDFNAADLFPGEKLTYAEWAPEKGIMAGHPIPPLGLIAPSWMVPDGTAVQAKPWLLNWATTWLPFLDNFLIPARSTNWYACQDFPPPRFEFRYRSYPVWYRRTGPPVSFVWVVKAPATRGLLFNDFLGLTSGVNLIPEMTAVAVARPVGGNIEEGRNEYRTKMEPVASSMLVNRLFGGSLPGVLQRWGTNNIGVVPEPDYYRGSRVVTH